MHGLACRLLLEGPSGGRFIETDLVDLDRGDLYTAGVFFYVKTNIPWAYFIWHLLVIGGTMDSQVGITLR